MDIRLPFEGFYESTYSDLIDDEMQEQGLDNVDYMLVHAALAREYTKHMRWELGIKSLVFKELNSPSYYNFETDMIICDISIEDVKHMFNTVMDDRECLDSVCKDLFTSYDGFISFYSPKWETWSKDLVDWDVNQLYALIKAFILHSEDNTEETIREYMVCNGIISQCIDKGLDIDK